MTTMNELRTKRADLWEKTKDFLDTHQGDDGRLSAEDDATYSAMMDDMDAHRFCYHPHGKSRSHR